MIDVAELDHGHHGGEPEHALEDEDEHVGERHEHHVDGAESKHAACESAERSAGHDVDGHVG